MNLPRLQIVFLKRTDPRAQDTYYLGLHTSTLAAVHRVHADPTLLNDRRVAQATHIPWLALIAAFLPWHTNAAKGKK